MIELLNWITLLMLKFQEEKWADWKTPCILYRVRSICWWLQWEGTVAGYRQISIRLSKRYCIDFMAIVWKSKCEVLKNVIMIMRFDWFFKFDCRVAFKVFSAVHESTWWWWSCYPLSSADTGLCWSKGFNGVWCTCILHVLLMLIVHISMIWYDELNVF